MTTFRFIHTSDLHLGRRFANIPEPADGNVRGRLMEARHGAIARIAAAAREAGAAHVLVAGDIFDTATPSSSVVRQALGAMADEAGVSWWLLPGNHDNLRDAEPLWDSILRDAPTNVRAVTEAGPVDLEPGATLLPCPVVFRSSATDMTAALETMPSDEGALRIGLAHGGVVDFTESGANIPPDRDRTARLDYLALGDWHGRLAVGSRVHYSGSPEQDRFRHDRRGVCLAVTLDGPGAAPRVDEVDTGVFLWREDELALTPGQDAAAALEALTPAGGRRDTLLRVRATGWSGLDEQADMIRAGERLAPEFAHFELLTDRLGVHCEANDLDAIDRAGALRLAAERLLDDVDDAALTAEEREVAAAALARLYSYVREAGR